MRRGERHSPQGQSQQHRAVRGCNSNPPGSAKGRREPHCPLTMESYLFGGRSCPYRRLGKQPRFSIFSMWFWKKKKIKQRVFLLHEKSDFGRQPGITPTSHRQHDVPPLPQELYGGGMGLRQHGQTSMVQKDPKAPHAGLKNTEWLTPDPRSNSIGGTVIGGEHFQPLWPCGEAKLRSRTGGVCGPPEEAFTHRTRADPHCPAPPVMPYLLQVEAVNLPQALESPNSTDVLPVQADGRGGHQLRGSRGRGTLGVSFVPRDPPRQPG